IVGLPTDMFYNTGISTYIWVLNKAKPEDRRGKVQLIDATEMYAKMRKSVGSKRHRLTDDNIATIAQLYADFEETEHSKIFNNTDFYYRTITVERPLRLNYAYTTERIERVLAARAITRLDDHTQTALRHVLEQAQEEHDVVFAQRQVFYDDLTTRLNQAG